MPGVASTVGELPQAFLSGGSATRPRKLPHGLTVQELKELTAARLAQEAIERKGGHSPRPVLPQPLQQRNPNHLRQHNSAKRRQHRSTNSPYRNAGSALPRNSESPSSFAVVPGASSPYGAMHQNNRHHAPNPNNRFEFSPHTIPNEQFQPLYAHQKLESPMKPEEIPVRPRHWSVDSVSTLGSEFLGSEKSPFTTPYRKVGNESSVEHPSEANLMSLHDSIHGMFETGRARSFPEAPDLGEAVESQALRPRHHSYDLITSPNPTFSERREIRSPFLSTPFWALQEDKPSVESVIPSVFDPSASMNNLTRDSNPIPHDSPFAGFDNFQRKAKSFPTRFVNSLSLPVTDDDFRIGQEEERPLHPIPVPRQQSSGSELPHWVAESVLVTPQREIRKIVGDEKSVKSDSAAIFRSIDEQRSPPTSTWIRSNSSSGGIESRPNSFSFGAFDSLAGSLGTTLNLGSNPSVQAEAATEKGVGSDSIFHRSLIDHPSSSEESAPHSENEESLSSAPIEYNSRPQVGSFWPKTNCFGWRKKEGYQD